MPTKDELATAIKVIKEVAGDPDSGAIKELILLIEESGKATNEVRVTAVKETR